MARSRDVHGSEVRRIGRWIDDRPWTIPFLLAALVLGTWVTRGAIVGLWLAWTGLAWREIWSPPPQEPIVTGRAAQVVGGVALVATVGYWISTFWWWA